MRPRISGSFSLVMWHLADGTSLRAGECVGVCSLIISAGLPGPTRGPAAAGPSRPGLAGRAIEGADMLR